jgi:hypothetical protein
LLAGVELNILTTSASESRILLRQRAYAPVLASFKARRMVGRVVITNDTLEEVNDAVVIS